MEVSFAPAVPEKCQDCLFVQQRAAELGEGHAALSQVAEGHLRTQAELQRPEYGDVHIQVSTINAETQARIGEALFVREQQFAAGVQACAGYTGACAMPQDYANQLTW